MASDLSNLRIDRQERQGQARRPVLPWIAAGALLVVLLVAGFLLYQRSTSTVEVETTRVTAAGASASGPGVILNATGYIVAAHKIEVSAKVVGRVAWIGVDKGDRVRQGQVIVRLEDEEYRAQLEQARGQLASMEAHLRELEAGSRPQEIAQASADVEQARADLVNARLTLNRTRQLVGEGVLSKQALDDAQARYDAQVARVASLEKRFELVRLGPRQEETDQARGQVRQARGAVQFFETQLANTVIHAPVSGTILERAV
ncbi:MAG: biotin/lipoyl-binding protein, partial [Bryobacteraceae bacterium]